MHPLGPRLGVGLGVEGVGAVVVLVGRRREEGEGCEQLVALEEEQVLREDWVPEWELRLDHSALPGIVVDRDKTLQWEGLEFAEAGFALASDAVVGAVDVGAVDVDAAVAAHAVAERLVPEVVVAAVVAAEEDGFVVAVWLLLLLLFCRLPARPLRNHPWILGVPHRPMDSKESAALQPERAPSKQPCLGAVASWKQGEEQPALGVDQQMSAGEESSTDRSWPVVWLRCRCCSPLFSRNERLLVCFVVTFLFNAKEVISTSFITPRHTRKDSISPGYLFF